MQWLHARERQNKNFHDYSIASIVYLGIIHLAPKKPVCLYLVGIKMCHKNLLLGALSYLFFITNLQKKLCSVHIFDNSKHVQVHVRWVIRAESSLWRKIAVQKLKSVTKLKYHNSIA